LVGVLGEGDERVADEVRNGLGAGDVEQDAQAGQLVLVELAARLAGDDVRQQVVAGRGTPLCEVRDEVGAQLARRGARAVRQPVVSPRPRPA
jgi:hypothetical protein